MKNYELIVVTRALTLSLSWSVLYSLFTIFQFPSEDRIPTSWWKQTLAL